MKYLSIICITTMLWAGSMSNELAEMNQATRENIIIQLESIGQPTQEMLNAENLWNTGQYVKAIELIAQIEENEPLAAAFSFHNPPVTPQPLWATDVQVNSTNFNLRDVELIYARNGNLFVLAEGDSSGNHRWFIHRSTDGGFNWTTTAIYSGATSDIVAVDAGEHTDYIYIAYCYTAAPTTGRLRRVFETTGAMDGTFGYVNAFTTTGNIQEVNFEPNRYSWNEMYYSAICDLNVLHFFYALASNPTTWNGVASNTNNAERALDMDYGYMSGSSHLIWLSFISTADSLCARSLTGGPSWGVHNNIDNVYTATWTSTAIAQHGDTVLILFVEPTLYQRYHITYNDGGSWPVGTIDSDSSSAGDVTGRGGEGWHVSWAKYFVSAPEDVYYRSRSYSGGWQTPQLVGEQDEFINYRTSIDYLGSAGAYGIAYINDNFDVYFDRLDWVPGVAESKFDKNGRFVNLAPNPSRGLVNLSFALNTETMVKISMYDVTGRLVKTLINETRPAGTHTIAIDNQNLTSGTYFVRVETDAGATTKKMTIIR